MKEKIFIETPFLYHLPFITYHFFKGNEVIVLDVNRELRGVANKRWFIWLIRKKWISRYYIFRDRHEGLSLEAVDAIYDATIKNSTMVKSMVDIYGDNTIEMAYKKELAWELAVFYGVQLILKKESDSRSCVGRIILYPYKYHTYLKLVKECKCFSYDITNLSFPLWALFVSKIQQSFIDLISYVLFILSALSFTIGIFLKKIISFKIVKRTVFRYAIAIRDPLFQFQFGGNRTFDFLLDHKNIRKDNTLFLSLSPISNLRIKNLKLNGYNIVDCSSIFYAINTISRDNAKDLFGVLVKYLFVNILGSIFKQSFYLIANMKLIGTFIIWRGLLDKYEFEHFISANDPGITHIGRNILLSKNNCKTWHYAHSGSLNYIFANKNQSSDNLRAWRLSYLYYDYWALWNKDAVEYAEKHPNKVKKYVNTGCIWSELICNSGIKDIKTYLEANNLKTRINKDFKILSFFDTSYFEGDTSDVNLSDGIKFYKDIFKFLNEEDSVFIVVKEKKSMNHYISYSYHRMYPELVKEYAHILNQLNSHPRCFIAGVKGDPSEIIAVSDITISHAFTSPTIDAICARKKAFFHDPKNRFRGYYYDRIPALVSHNFDELKGNIETLLATSDDDYDKYLNDHILHNVEDYLDGKALSRFQELVTNKCQK